MFEAFFTDSCLRYRIEVINGIDFYGLGFGMVRGESMGKWISQWMQKGETASVLITNTKLPDTSGFEIERIASMSTRQLLVQRSARVFRVAICRSDGIDHYEKPKLLLGHCGRKKVSVQSAIGIN